MSIGDFSPTGKANCSDSMTTFSSGKCEIAVTVVDICGNDTMTIVDVSLKR